MKSRRFISFVLISLLLISFISAGSGAFYLSDKSNPSQNYFSVNGSIGGIGIGLSNILSIFHVNLSDSLTGFIIESNSSQLDGVSSRLGLIDIYGANTSSTSSAWYFDNYFTDFRIFQKPNITASTSTESVALFIESTNNYVGIGTSTPKNTLNVDGDMRISGASYGIFPTGMIAPFNLDACPTGWTLADGSGGTPNLIGKFILANTTRGSTGGSTTISLSNMPSHSHRFSPGGATDASGGPSTPNTGSAGGASGSAGGAHTHSVSIRTGSHGAGSYAAVGGGTATGQTFADGTSANSHGHAMAHTHSMTHGHTVDLPATPSSQTGSGTAYYQPYYTLIFCMKT